MEALNVLARAAVALDAMAADARVGSIDIYEKVSLGNPLTQEEQKSWDNTLERWRRIIEKANELGVPVMVDAEESWIQPAVDDLAIQYMRTYNQGKAIV